jgi:hypothetical protein
LSLRIAATAGFSSIGQHRNVMPSLDRPTHGYTG